MGTKNKPAASKEKSSNNKSSKEKSSKLRNKKGGSTPSSSKSTITVMLSEAQASKIIKNSKVITVHELARQTGVKISAANAFLRDAAKRGVVTVVGGNSGHRIYQPVS